MMERDQETVNSADNLIPLEEVSNTPAKENDGAKSKVASKKSPPKRSSPKRSPSNPKSPSSKKPDSPTTLNDRYVRFRSKDSTIEMDHIEAIPDIDVDTIPVFATVEAGTDPVIKRPAKTEHKTKALVAILFVVIVVGISLIYHFYNARQIDIQLGKRLIFDKDARQLLVYNSQEKLSLTIDLGTGIPFDHLPLDCTETDANQICIKWKNEAQVEMTSTDLEDGIHCYNIAWTSLLETFEPSDCILLEKPTAHWYGGGLMPGQPWPFDAASMPKTPFFVGSIDDTNSFGAVVERYWVSTRGISITVDQETPLFVSVNAPDADEPLVNQTDGKFCMYASYKDVPYLNTAHGFPSLNYSVCVGEGVVDIHKHVILNAVRAPGATPSKELLKNPVWSTWAMFKDDISQQNILEFASNISAHGLKHSGLIIDDGWEGRYGDFKFDKTYFPDPSAMIADLKSKGLNVLLNVHPYVNYDSEAFQYAVEQDFLVKDKKGNVPGLTRWFDGPPSERYDRGIAGVVDMFPTARDWFMHHLGNLSLTYDLSGVVVSGGEVDLLPSFPTFGFNASGPNEYIETLGAASSMFAEASVLRAAHRLQHMPIFIQLHGQSSSWQHLHNGLQAVIPSVLTLGVLGYPFVIPGAIGGCAYTNFPSKELYIRWMQLTAFLPTMHFSIPPSYYGDVNIMKIAKEMIELHATQVLPEVMRVAENAAITLEPIIRPLWWVDGYDPDTWFCDSQFLVGDNILVAPILHDGARERDVYLPLGNWEDKLTGKMHTGPLWLYHYRIELNKIAYFILKGNRS